MAGPVVLVFRAKTPASTTLVFRAAGTPAPVTISLQAAGGARGEFHAVFRIALGQLALDAKGGTRGYAVGRYVHAVGKLDGRTGAVGEVIGDYFGRYWRGLAAATESRFGGGTAAAVTIEAPRKAGAPVSVAHRLGSARATTMGGQALVEWGAGAALGLGTRVAIGRSNEQAGASASVWWGPASRVFAISAFPFGAGTQAGSDFGAAWELAARLQREVRAAVGFGTPVRISLFVRFTGGSGISRKWDMPWRPGVRPPFGFRPPIPPELPSRAPFRGDTHLVFRGSTLGDTRLVFRRIGPPRIMASISEVYIVQNSAYVKRVSDNAEIECRSVRISGDWQSWGRRFSGESFPSEAGLLDVLNGPVEIEIGANGTVWRCLVTSRPERSKFAADTLSWEGYSLASEIAAPRASATSRVNSGTASAQQLALLELDQTGWALDWQMIDPVIPAGIYSLDNATPMDALVALAQAYGGFVATDRAARIVSVRPRYRAMPWHWGAETPDVVLPPDILDAKASEFVEKADYDGIYISGQSVGANVLVVRDGMPGAVLPQMIVDPLLTDPQANFARGAAVLADAQVRQKATIRLPLAPEIGLVEPGSLVRIDALPAWTSLATALDVDIEWESSVGLTVWQTVTLGDVSPSSVASLRSLIAPADPLLVGTVASVGGDGTSIVAYSGGRSARVRGTGFAPGAKVFVRAGEIRGAAPALDTMTMVVT